jgi:GNAT superfamily N-acetyltransferase
MQMIRPAGAAPRGKVTFRPIQDSDKEFLYQLFLTTREEEFSYLDWSGGDKDHLLRGQFEAQSLSYQMNFLGASFRIIQLDSEDIGRLYADRQDDCLYIIDLTITPTHKAKGLGSDIVGALLNEAHGGKVPVKLKVAKNNPAALWYQNRFGFAATQDLGHYWAMEWRPYTGPREI